MFEHYLVLEYRMSLLQMQANHFCHHLVNDLRPFISESFFIKKEGVKYIKFSNALYYPIVKLDDSVCNGHVVTSNIIETTNVKSIQDIISTIVTAPCAHLSSDCVAQGEKILAHKVASAIEELIQVCHCTCLIHLFLSDNCIFKALQLNSTCSVHRNLHGLSEPFFLDNP